MLIVEELGKGACSPTKVKETADEKDHGSCPYSYANDLSS